MVKPVLAFVLLVLSFTVSAIAFYYQGRLSAQRECTDVLRELRAGLHR